MSLSAQSHLVGADQVYTARDGLAVFVAGVSSGWVTADIYSGTTRRERIRIPRAVFVAIFTNYSFKGDSDEPQADRAVAAGGCGVARHAVRPGLHAADDCGVAGGVSS